MDLLTIAIATTCIAAALMLAGAEIVVCTAGRPPHLRHALSAVGLWLCACGLWWPVHVMPTPGTLAAADGWVSLVGWLPAGALACCAAWAASAIGRRAWVEVIGASVATVISSYAFAMFGVPGVFRLPQMVDLFGAGAALLLLAACVVLLTLGRPPGTWGWLGRLAPSLVAAAIVTVAASSAQADGTVPQAPGIAETGAWLTIVAMGLVCAAALRHAPGSIVEGAGRPVRSPPVDALTGLPTRLFFESRLARAARKCDAKGARLAVFFIDLDGFKPVNDTYGHSCGDCVLQHVGRRLKAISRKVDVAARIGGDEFLLLMPGISGPETVGQVAQRLIEAMSRPYRVEDREVAISCSVGIALYPDGCSPGKLIARADVAMYAAKRAGGSRHAFYAPSMETDAQQNFALVRDLRQAIAGNELELYYQPKIDARSGKVTAAEALLRWQHPKLGLVMPGQFIPLAERACLIGPLGDWVIEAACSRAAHGGTAACACGSRSISRPTRCGRTTSPSASARRSSATASIRRC